MEGKLTGFSGSRERTSSDIWKIRLRIIKLLLILGLLLGAAGLSWILPPTFQYFDLLLGVTFGLFAFFMLYRTGHFEYGIIAIALSAILLNFFTIPTGTESRIVISLVVAVVLISIWFLQLIVTKDREQIRPSAINAPIILFVVVNLISYFWGNMLRDPLVEVWSSFPLVQLGALAVNILLPLLALMVANKVRDVKWLEILSWLIIGIGALVVVSYFFQLPTLAAVSNGARGLFATWVAALAFGLILFQRESFYCRLNFSYCYAGGRLVLLSFCYAHLLVIGVDTSLCGLGYSLILPFQKTLFGCPCPGACSLHSSI
jgi:hypothetical protein